MPGITRSGLEAPLISAGQFLLPWKRCNSIHKQPPIPPYSLCRCNLLNHRKSMETSGANLDHLRSIWPCPLTITHVHHYTLTCISVSISILVLSVHASFGCNNHPGHYHLREETGDGGSNDQEAAGGRLQAVLII